MSRTLDFQTPCVRENPCQKSTMNKLYEQRHETGDIKFLIDSAVIPAHRNIMAAISPKYKTQFYGHMAEKNVIHVNGVTAAAFQEFLQFFYTDKVALTMENIEDVLSLCKQSLVDDLVNECSNFLIDEVRLVQLLWCYELAGQYGLDQLKKHCIKQIGVNIKILFKMAIFLDCERDMLCNILDFDWLNCNEKDVFEGCISWARAKCKQNGMNASTADLRTELGDALFKIRFCSMAAEDFARIDKKYPGLLLEQESIEVFHAIILKSNGEISSIFGENNSKPRKRNFVDSSENGNTNKRFRFRSPIRVNIRDEELSNNYAADTFLLPPLFNVKL